MEGITPAPHRRSWRRRVMRWVLVLCVLALLLTLVHRPLLHGLGAWLWKETSLAHADVVCVLGGGARDRGRSAAELYHRGFADRFICTGGQVPGDVEVLGMPFKESDLTGYQVVTNRVPASAVLSLRVGTSTQEEADALLPRLQKDGADTVIIVSHRFHLRRIHYVFTERYRRAGITVLLHGAPNGDFDERTWWRSEPGMIMVFNEYAKLLYYAVKH
jgi:uncharacterized SAM-binding protein YcdF (DUF218 family)